MITRGTTAILLFCMFPGVVWAQTNQRLAQPAFALTHVTLIDGTGSAPQPDKSVVIAGNRITEIIDANAPLPKGTRRVSAKGKFLIPGLWDMHVHLKKSDLAPLVAYGVTGVRDMGNVLADVEAWRAEIAVGAMIGPRIVRVGPILNGKVFGPAQVAIETDSEARVAVRLLKQVGVDAIKVHRLVPRAAYFALADEAQKLSIPFVGHVPRSVSAYEASNAGQASIEHIETLFDSDMPLKRQDAAELFALFVKNHTAYDPTLVAYRGSTDSANVDSQLLRKYPDLIQGRRRLFKQFLELVGIMNQVGVTLLAGTDLGVRWITPGVSLHEELAQLCEAGLTPMQALQAATRNPGRFLSLNAGTVEVGKSANLVLLDANPLDDIRNTTRIRAVVLEGKLFDRSQLDALLGRPQVRAHQP